MRWYRSLYWRIALGVVAFLAAMLVVQAMLFVWVVSQSGRSLPGQSPGRLGRTVALDLANLLERDPKADLAQYVREQYAQYEHPFFVMMSDDRVITSGSRAFPEPLLRMARARLEHGDIGRPMRPGGADAELPDSPPERPRSPRFGPRFGGDRFGPAPIVVDGRLAGVVVVPPRAPFGFLLGRYAPVLTLVALGVLVVGAIMTSALIFGPARRRLRALESAARRLGGGDLSARAPDRGGDEIAAVATAFNAMADDLAARAEALAEADRTRRQLLADVSHELNTPVTAVRGYVDTLLMDELRLDDATRARYLRIIGDETARLERLIGELLDLAKLEGGGGSLRIERVNTEQLFERVLARHERAGADAGLRFESLVGEGAGSIAADPDRLEQALQNLAANAIRYAPRGSAIRLAARRAEGATVLSVADQGRGIPPDQLPRVFDRFYKGDASRASRAAAGGSGLGLSIVKAIAERHGGRVEVRSRPGETVFELVLPDRDAGSQQGAASA
jgi:two-component system OmpR family sensor kinase